MALDRMRAYALALGLLVGLLLGGCAGGEDRRPTATPGPSATAAPRAEASSPAGAVVARYGSGVLTEDELIAALSRLPVHSRLSMTPEARRRFVDGYVLNELLFAEGKAQGLDRDPEVQRQVRELEKRLVVQKLVRRYQQEVPPVTDAEVRASYDEHPERYSTTTIRARHILLKGEETAKEVLAEVRKDPDRFAEIAKERSVDKASARRGGELGFFGRGRMVPEFEAAAFALREPGELSGIVRTPYGFHIIQLEERREGKPRPFEQVAAQIRRTIRNRRVRERTEKAYAELRQKAGVEIDDAAIERAAARVPEPSPGDRGAFRAFGH